MVHVLVACGHVEVSICINTGAHIVVNRIIAVEIATVVFNSIAAMKKIK